MQTGFLCFALPGRGGCAVQRRALPLVGKFAEGLLADTDTDVCSSPRQGSGATSLVSGLPCFHPAPGAPSLRGHTLQPPPQFTRLLNAQVCAQQVLGAPGCWCPMHHNSIFNSTSRVAGARGLSASTAPRFVCPRERILLSPRLCHVN